MPVGEAAALDAAKLEQFVTRAVEEVGATVGAALVVMGDRLGLYRALAGAGALTSGELAARTGAAERYVREWLNAQAAGGYVKYHADEGRYSLPPEQAVALTDEDSSAYRRARGEVAQHLIGTNTTELNVIGEPAPNLRFVFNLEP
jgi:winged helix-turn-helix protein